MNRQSLFAAPTPIAVFFALILLGGCVQTPADTTAPQPTLVVDENRPDTEFGEIVTGPAVQPDLNATTAAEPRLVEGEWWRIKFDSDVLGEHVEFIRVVGNVTHDRYIMGMPHEGWYKEAIAYHAPAFGDVMLNLSYNTHNVMFTPVKFPLRQGDEWFTNLAATPYRATVEAADEYTATILLSPAAEPQPTDAVTALMFGGASPNIHVYYDARMHEVVRMESFIGVWEVIEHGYGFEGWVTVPRGEHTAIDYGTFGPANAVSPGGPNQPSVTREISVNGGFNRITMMHLILPISPGMYRIRSTTPNGAEFLTETSDNSKWTLKFYEELNPDGTWTQEDFVAGVAATYSMGIAYHQYDIHLPDGQRRTDHAHPVVR